MRSGVILAGGFSRRLGTNKAFVRLGNKPMIRWIHDAVQPAVSEIIVVINQMHIAEDYSGRLPGNVRIVKDAYPGQTPVIGIYTGMMSVRSDYSFITACDSPFIQPGIIRRLFEAADGYDAAIPKWSDGHIEPLVSVYKAETTQRAAQEAHKKGELSNADIIKRLDHVVYVGVEDDLKKFDSELFSFFNINTRAELQKAVDLVRKKPKQFVRR